MNTRNLADRVVSQGDDLPDDPRLLRAVQEYLDQLEGGRHPNRQEFLRRYADIAEPLARCLDGLELVVGSASRAGTQQQAPLGSRHLPTNPIGDFRIVREIGRGGMGIVYEAVQLSLGRRVALKVLPFAAAFDAKHLQRFHNEAQAAAQLHHTNIVPVYAVGCERGVHFYAMQLIEGQSLAAVVRQLRQQADRSADAETAGGQAAPPRMLIEDMPPTVSHPPLAPSIEETPDTETVSPLSLALSTQRSGKDPQFFRAIARFIVQAAEALEHAHQFGIIHRDIKPANLLVDAHGRLWITDFGLAQFHADAGLTQTGDILGTLRYMSPEQASGQRVLLDHRTDVYALGATLYELVTLEPIFPGQDRQQLLHQIINEEPRAPRSVEKTVPVELETIILKAVSKAPSDRYGSAQELADDLRRFLEDKPIRARRPSLLERARKWSRRHPEIVTAGVVLLLLCIAGLFINNRMIAQEKDRTKQALEGQRQRALEAEKLFQQARGAVDLLVQVCDEELADLPPHLQGARKRLLEMALVYYQDFIEEQQGDDRVQAELAQGRDRVQRILKELAALQRAHKQILAANPAVQQDLKLSDAQWERIARLGSGRSKPPLLYSSSDHGPNNPKAHPQLFPKVAIKNGEELDKILTPQQRQRLEQIALQSQGLLAFREPRVIEALRLTADQKQQIRRIGNGLAGKMRPRPPHHGESVPEDFRTRIAKAQRAAMQEVVALFSPEQVKQWHEMIGEPFEGADLFPPPPGPFAPR